MSEKSGYIKPLRGQLFALKAMHRTKGKQRSGWMTFLHKKVEAKFSFASTWCGCSYRIYLQMP